tara:strand:- start:2049 stop:2570 length:522 start_codon:yes stop_codon:yes gene_type:complete
MDVSYGVGVLIMNYQQNMDRIAKEIAAIKLDISHRDKQHQAWSSVRRSYATNYQVSIFPTSGKYYDFGGRRSKHASGQDAKNAEYYLTKVIPQEMAKLNARKAVLQQEQRTAIKAEELRNIARIQAEMRAEEKRMKAEAKKKRQMAHPEGSTTRSPRPRHPSGANPKYAPKRR